MTTEGKEKQPHTTVKTVAKKLIPLWILIIINLATIIPVLWKYCNYHSGVVRSLYLGLLLTGCIIGSIVYLIAWGVITKSWRKKL